MPHADSHAQAHNRRILVCIESGRAIAPSAADAPAAFWASISPASPGAAELASKVQTRFGKELHAALAAYLAQGSPSDPRQPARPALFFFAVDPPERWEGSGARIGVTILGVETLLALFDHDVELLGAVLHSLVPDALRRATGLTEVSFEAAVELGELRDAARERDASADATWSELGDAGRGGARADGAADKKGRSLSELLQRTPVVLALIAALIAGYVIGGTRQEERRHWAETEAKVFEQQNALLAACTSDKNAAAALCKDEKQQIATSHLELIRAYKEREETARTTPQAVAARPAGSSAAPTAPSR